MTWYQKRTFFLSVPEIKIQNGSTLKFTWFCLCLILQCLSLKCCPQHGAWRWQPLIAQIPAGKSKATLPLHDGLQFSRITKKNNHIPCNMRCWKCCPPSSTHFWHLFRKCAFTQINSISETQSISRLILAFSSSNVWVFVAYTLFFKCPHR